MGGISISDPSDRFEQAAEKSASRIVTAQAISPTGLGKPVPKRIVPIGSHTPQTVVVQRVPFPPLPENFETLGEGQHAVFEQYLIALLVKLRDELNKHNYILGKPDEPEHTKYKNSMDTIKIQKDKIDVMIGEVELFIYWHVELKKGIGPKDQKQLRSLIVDVNKLKELKDLAPSAPSSQNKDESLTKGEEAQLKIMLNAARDRIIQSLKQEEKLSLAFGKDSEATAKDNFQKIIYHLEFWKKQPQTRVRIKRSMGEYAALNHGFGGGSILWLGVNFFNKEDMEKNVGILIHEASHGSVGTKDHAYIGDPHFHVLQTIPSNLALDNADHYKYAVALAFGEAIGPEQSTEGVSNEEHMLGAARTLAFYKSRKIVEFAIWMHDHYMRMHDPATKGLGTLEPETIFLHADLLSLTEVKLPQLWPTLAVHASTLLKVFNSCLSYFKSNLKFTLSHISNNNFEMTINIPIDVQLDNTITDASLDEISNAMLKALVRKTFELPEPIASKLIDVGEQLLNHRFEIGREQNIYHIDENDINLHSRLKAGNTRSRSASKESISTGKYRFL